MAQPHLAVIGPRFFGYAESISEELTLRGWAISRFDEKYSNSNWRKSLFRLGLGLHRGSAQRRYLDRLAARIEETRTPEVLLVGVEVIDRPFVARLVSAGVRVHLYMWDASANKGRFQSYLDLLASAATFDPADAKRLGLACIPLFASAEFHRQQSPERYDLAFCGTMHTDRIMAIAGIAASSSGLKLGFALYYHSRWLFAVRCMMSRRAWRLLPLVATSPLPRNAVAALFAGSRFVLDIPHPRQTGLTARTFEALAAGARVITDRHETARLLPASLRPRIHVVERWTDVAAILRQPRNPLPALAEADRHYLSIRRFGDELQAQIIAAREAGAGSGNRTRLASLEG